LKSVYAPNTEGNALQHTPAQTLQHAATHCNTDLYAPGSAGGDPEAYISVALPSAGEQGREAAYSSRTTLPDAPGRPHAQHGDVEAPLIVREHNRRRESEQHDGPHLTGASPSPPAVLPLSESERIRVQERERARKMVERGNAAITAGDFAEAAMQFQQAHDVLKEVEGAASPAVHKTKALAKAMERKAAQVLYLPQMPHFPAKRSMYFTKTDADMHIATGPSIYPCVFWCGGSSSDR